MTDVVEEGLPDGLVVEHMESPGSLSRYAWWSGCQR